MARIKNDIFKLSGSLGDLTFSQDELGTIVKMKGGTSKKRIKKHPRSQRTRESNMEMGGASTAAKTLRLALLQNKNGMKDRYFSGRLNGLMRKVVALGPGKPGERKLDIRQNGALLETFEFINARPLVYSVGGIKEKPTLNADRNEVYWTSPNLSTKNQISAPTEATHFKYLLGAATVSNYEFNADQKKYLPVESNFKASAVFIESEAINLKQKTIAPISLNLKLDKTIALAEEVAVVTVIGVAFFRNVNGELLEIKDSGGMRVLGVG